MSSSLNSNNLTTPYLQVNNSLNYVSVQNVIVGDLGENITTKDIDLLGLPVNTRLRIGEEAVVRVTGLRNPCAQIEAFQKGLLGKCLTFKEGKVVRKAGIMSVVEIGGVVKPGDTIHVFLPEGAYKPLAVV